MYSWFVYYWLYISSTSVSSITKETCFIMSVTSLSVAIVVFRQDVGGDNLELCSFSKGLVRFFDTSKSQISFMSQIRFQRNHKTDVIPRIYILSFLQFYSASNISVMSETFLLKKKIVTFGCENFLILKKVT